MCQCVDLVALVSPNIITANIFDIDFFETNVLAECGAVERKGLWGFSCVENKSSH